MDPHNLYIYNSLTSSKEKFKPLRKNSVGMYVCGPTVYSNVHLGNCRTFISFDIIFRYLRYLGYNVRDVRNITDVGHLEDTGEDKISKKAKVEKLEPMEIAQKYTNSFREVLKNFSKTLKNFILFPFILMRHFGKLILKIKEKEFSLLEMTEIENLIKL